MAKTDASFPDRVRTALRGRRDRVAATDLADELGVGLDEEDLFWELEADDHELKWWPGESWSHVPTLLDGVVAAHRLTAAEIAGGWLLDATDTAVLLAHNPAPLIDGEPLEQSRDRPYRWLLPGDLPDGSAPGDVLLLRHHLDGIDLEVVDPGEVELAATTDEEVERLRTMVEELTWEADLEVRDLVLELALHWPGFLTSPRALGDVLDQAGLPVVGDHVLSPDTDPDTWWVQRRRAQIDPEGTWPLRAVDACITVLDHLWPRDRAPQRTPDETTARAMVAALADETTTSLVLSKAIATPFDGTASTGDVQRLLDELVELADDDLTAGVHVLRSQLAERRRDLDEQLAETAAALELDPRFGPALADRVVDLEDRGDREAASACLLRAGDWSDARRRERLQQLGATRYPDAARNDPCPCGSGRKYKRCHEEGGEVDDMVRAEWLVARATDWLVRPAQRPLFAEVGQAYRAGPGALLRDDLAMTITLFEDGALRAYREGRGGLLPEQDLALLDRWLSETRTELWEVAMDPSERAAVLRSDLDDRTVELREPDDLDVLELVTSHRWVAYVLRLADGTRPGLLAGAPVPAGHEDELREAIASDEPGAVARWYDAHRHLIDRIELDDAAEPAGEPERFEWPGLS